MKGTRRTQDFVHHPLAPIFLDRWSPRVAIGLGASSAIAAGLVLMLAPFSPHIAEELWQNLGHEGGLLKSVRWPQADPELARRDELEIPIQVNGKLRSRLLVSPEVTEEHLRTVALNDEKIRSLIDGREVVKVIVVPQRLVNVVVR